MEWNEKNRKNGIFQFSLKNINTSMLTCIIVALCQLGLKMEYVGRDLIGFPILYKIMNNEEWGRNERELIKSTDSFFHQERGSIVNSEMEWNGE